MKNELYSPLRAFLLVFVGISLSTACADDEAEGDADGIEQKGIEPDNIILAEELALRYMSEHPPDDIGEMAWDWAEAVLMQSLVELHRATGDIRFQSYYKDWMDAHIEAGYSIKWNDSCPPAVIALALYDETGNAKYQQVVDDVLLYLFEDAKRTEQGAISHLGSLRETVWADSLFMFGGILTRYGEFTGNKDYLDEFGNQLSIFSEILQDESGLFLHAHNWPASTETDIFWLRGNGWVTAAGFDYLRVRGVSSQPEVSETTILTRQVEKLLEFQDEETGLWWNIINRPQEIYLETSGSALVAYGMARGLRFGHLTDDVLPALEKAMMGIKSKIARDEKNRPFVTDISWQTTAGNFEDYAAVPLVSDMDFGVGAVVLALMETAALASL